MPGGWILGEGFTHLSPRRRILVVDCNEIGFVARHAWDDWVEAPGRQFEPLHQFFLTTELECHGGHSDKQDEAA
jgi:hypothetical protein